jgi:hypothetical protein
LGEKGVGGRVCQKNRVEVSSRLDLETAKTFVHRSDSGLWRTLKTFGANRPRTATIVHCGGSFLIHTAIRQQGKIGFFYDLSYNARTTSASVLCHKSHATIPSNGNLC